MTRLRRARAPASGFAAALLLLTGCAAGDRLMVAEWSLEVPGAAPVGVTLPAYLDVPSEDLDYHLRAEVDLPDRWRGRAVDLWLPGVVAITSLVADGAHVERVVGSGTGYREPSPAAHRIPAEATADGHVELDLTLAHRWRHSAWVTTTPRLAPAEVPDPASVRARRFHSVIGLIGAVAFALTALTYLAVWVGHRHRLGYLYFSLQALFASTYCVWVEGALRLWVGRYDTVLFAMALFGASASASAFTRVHYGLGGPSRLWTRANVAAAAVMVAFSGPYVVSVVGAPLVVLSIGPLIAWHIVTCVRIARGGGPQRVEAGLHCAAWCSLGVTASFDFAWWLGLPDLFEGTRPAVLGLSLFSVFLTVGFAHGHVRLLAQSDALTEQLGARVDALELHGKQIERLNEELRRQIAERSAEIFSALALVSNVERAKDLAPGTVVHGRYRVLGRLGEGAMGTVYEVERLADSLRLALKISQERSASALARIAREAHVAARVRHPNVVGVVDVGVALEGFVYIVMEKVEGSSLQGLRRRWGDVSLGLSLLEPIARGIAALHDSGIVHRDIKPGNVLVDLTGPEPIARITDFGISRPARRAASGPSGSGEVSTALDDPTVAVGRACGQMPVSGTSSGSTEAATHASPSEPGTLTETGAFAGTPLYMAPELFELPDAFGAATDVYAFGVLAYQVLVGRKPFEGGIVLVRPTIDFASVCAGLSPALACTLDRCLSRDPSERPSAAEIADAIAAERLGGSEERTEIVAVP